MTILLAVLIGHWLADYLDDAWRDRFTGTEAQTVIERVEKLENQHEDIMKRLNY